MLIKMIMTRILIEGGILTLLFCGVAVGILYFRPRISLSDYPEDVKAIVPPRTKNELLVGIIITIPLLFLGVIIPLHSVWLLKVQNNGILTYWMSFITIFGEYFFFSMFDLIVLDMWMFCKWTPKFLVLPGTEGMAGYKNYKPHIKTQLFQGNILLIVLSAFLAIFPILLY